MSTSKTRVWCPTKALYDRTQQELARRKKNGLPWFGPQNADEEQKFWTDGITVYGMGFGSDTYVQGHVDAKANQLIQEMEELSILKTPVN